MHPELVDDIPASLDTSASAARDKATRAAVRAAGVVLMIALGCTHGGRLLSGILDFAGLYSGALLSGTGHLYDQTSVLAMSNRVIGASNDNYYYVRPPFYALVLKPLTMLPYRAALTLFVVLNLLALAWFVWRFASGTPELPIVIAFSLPVLACVLYGQDSLLVLFFAAAPVWQLRQRHDFTAGLILSLCAIKFHLFLLVPMALIIRHRWRALGGGVTGVAALTGLSFVAGGLSWPAAYWATLRNPEISSGMICMPNVRTLVYPLVGDNVLTAIILAGVVLALGVLAMVKAPDDEFALACALVGGLLLGLHGGIHDCVIGLLIFVMFLKSSKDKLIRIAATVSIAPPAALLLMAGSPFSAALPACYIILLAASLRAAITLQSPKCQHT